MTRPRDFILRAAELKRATENDKQQVRERAFFDLMAETLRDLGYGAGVSVAKSATAWKVKVDGLRR